jgi:hypothetical protein
MGLKPAGRDGRPARVEAGAYRIPSLARLLRLLLSEHGIRREDKPRPRAVEIKTHLLLRHRANREVIERGGLKRRLALQRVVRVGMQADVQYITGGND